MGTTQRRRMAWACAAVALLLVVSAWRRWMLESDSSGWLVPLVMYVIYVLLVCLWIRSIRRCMTQQVMRRCVCAEGILMFAGATMRFVQDTVLVSNIYLMRESGYLALIPLMAIPPLGWLGTLGLGHSSTYRPNPRWHWLAVPVLALVFLALSDSQLHLMCVVDPADPQPNLLFHPGFGAYLLAAWYIGLTLARIGLMTARNRSLGASRSPWPTLLVGACMAAAAAPYMLSSFAPDPDFVEFFARVFLFEALLWESCIATGLVPVNTGYEDVLHASTIALQLLDASGARLTGSADAPAIGRDDFLALTRGECVETSPGLELRAFGVRDAWCAWSQDVREQRRALAQLQDVREELSQRGDALAQELRVRGEAERVHSRALIYQALEEQIRPQREGLCRQVRELGQRLQDRDHPLGQDQCLRALEQIFQEGTQLKATCMSALLAPGDGAGEDRSSGQPIERGGA